jgi:predicted ATPase
VTFLFTDIEGSTRLWQQAGDAMRSAVARHDDILRRVIESRGGSVFSTSGDGMAAAFQAASSAVAAALAAQHALHEEEWSTAAAIRVRMGLHTGEAQQRDANYFGTTLNRTARLMEIGHGGEVLCSAATAALVEAEVPLVDLGDHRLRDLDRPVRVFQVGQGNFPPLRSLDTFPGNLPLQVSSFIGRDRELSRVAEALESSRVVTLTGVGGVGKTRLALQVAAEVLPSYRFGAWLCELAPVRGAGGVGEALAAVLDVSPRGGETQEEALVEFLRNKEVLLVLDNCEHVLDEAAELAEALERSCDRVRLLATSREGLGIDGERIIAVRSLGAPPADAPLGEIETSESVRLFLERARAAGASLDVSADNAGAIGQVCRRLDGVPLAIELAAARAPAMNPRELAARLDQRFQVLAGGRRGKVERHQTLRAAIDWSYDLLSPPEQLLLERVTVFSGGWALEAAEEVCPGGPVEAGSVLDLTERLVARSLVVAEDRGFQTRYRLLETIRQYGEERLGERGETDALRSRHAQFFANFLPALGRSLLGPDQIDAAKRIDAEQENLLAATTYAIDTDDADLGLRLMCGVPIPGVQLGDAWLTVPIEAVLRLTEADQHPLYPRALALDAGRASSRGDFAIAAQGCEAALAAAERLGSDPEHIVDEFVTNNRATIALGLGDHREAANQLQLGAEVARAAGRKGAAAFGLANAAIERTLAGDAAAAAPLANEGLELARRAGAPFAVGTNLLALAGALADSDRVRAEALLREWGQLDAASGYDNLTQGVQAVLVAARLEGWEDVLRLAPTAIRRNHWAGLRPQLVALFNVSARALVPLDAEGAAVLQGAARRLATESIGAPPPPSAAASSGSTSQRTGDAGVITALRRDTTGLLLEGLGETRLHELRALGEVMDDDHAAAYALDVIAKAQAVGTP